MQIQTERGIINIVSSYPSIERAEADGFRYAFTSNLLDQDIYSKCLDDQGLKHEFTLIGGK